MDHNTLHPTGKDAVLKISRIPDFDVNATPDRDPWRAVPWVKLHPWDNVVVQYETHVKLLYSDTGIYAFFWCEDNRITATHSHDQADLFDEDVVELFFWTDERYPIYFEYELSPLNHELILLVPNFNGRFLGWSPWHHDLSRQTRHATHIVKEGEAVKGWYAECYIPFALLTPLHNVPPVKGTIWRANMNRIDYDHGPGYWSWQPTRINFHDYERFGTLLFD
jgi:hypothetical protein